MEFDWNPSGARAFKGSGGAPRGRAGLKHELKHKEHRMNRFRTAAGLGAVVMVCAAGAAMVAAQPEKQEGAGAPPMDAQMQEMMEAYERAGKPGVQHEVLKQMVGTWDSEVRMFMPGMAEPAVSHGTMVNTMIHDGRYLQNEFRGEFDGEAFSGSGQFGYSNLGKKWQGTWLDSMSTSITFMTGTFDGRKGEWTMTGEIDHPMGYRAKQRDVITLQGSDAHSMTSYLTTKEGVEEKTMEILYTRKK